MISGWVVKTLRGGGDTQTLPSLIEFELFAFTGGGETKTLLSHTIVPKSHLVKLSQQWLLLLSRLQTVGFTDAYIECWGCTSPNDYTFVGCREPFHSTYAGVVTLRCDTATQCYVSDRVNSHFFMRDTGADPGGLGARPPLDPRFWDPKLSIFGPYLIFQYFFCLTLLRTLFL